LEHQVHVIRDDPDLEDPRVVTLGLPRQEAAQERGRAGVDKGLALQSRPSEMGVEADRHSPSLRSEGPRSVIASAQRGAFLRDRVLQDSLGPSRDFSPS